MKIKIEEKCQKGYKTHPKRKTKKMYGKTYRNCIKAEESKLKKDLEEKKKRKKKKKKVKKKKGKRDACYHKVKSRYDVWPSAYASGALVKCRKVGAKNWGNKSKKNEAVELKEKKNCGCGQDPCKTYGKVNEEFEPHTMYDPKTGQSKKANKEEDHHSLDKKGYTHVDSDVIRKEFEKEGGALGMKNLKKATGASEEEIQKTLDGMGDVLTHEDGDLIRTDGKQVKKEDLSLKKKIRVRIKRRMEEGI